jgi:Protein of unknown function (DUF3761)
MKRRTATLKTNADYIVQCVSLELHFLSVRVSIQGHDFSRASMRLLVFVISLAGQVSSALAYDCNNDHYVNSSGHLVHSPSCGEERQKPTADCRDGSFSFSEHHPGTCSHHGGVAHWD